MFPKFFRSRDFNKKTQKSKNFPTTPQIKIIFSSFFETKNEFFIFSSTNIANIQLREKMRMVCVYIRHIPFSLFFDVIGFGDDLVERKLIGKRGAPFFIFRSASFLYY